MEKVEFCWMDIITVLFYCKMIHNIISSNRNVIIIKINKTIYNLFITEYPVL